MSLQVWVPFNGDLRNRGLAGNFTLSVSGTEAYGAGKIAPQAVSINDGGYYYTVPELVGVANYSMCAWIKIDPTAEFTNYADIIRVWATAGSTDGYTRIEFRTQTYPGDCSAYFTKDKTVGSNANDYINVGGASISATEWIHLAMTKNANYASTYLNGQLLGSVACSNFEASPQTLTGYMSIGQTSTKAPALVNDFRVYDHCLSAKEVYELAKGLVYHYTLSLPGMPNLLKNSLTNFPVKYQESTITTQSNVEVPEWGCVDGLRVYGTAGTNSILGLINSTSHGIDSSNNGSLQLNGQDYTMSIYVKNNHATQIAYVRMNGTTPDATNMLPVQPGEAKRVYYTRTGNGTSGVQIILHASDAGQPYDITFWHPKIEYGDHATPWMPAMDDQIYTELGYDNNIEYDASGYCRNMTKTNISYSSDTARYTTSYVFDGSTGSWLSLGSTEYRFIKDEITVSIWGYMDDWTTMTSANSAASTMLVSSQEGGGFTIQTINSNYKFRFTVGTGTTANTYKYADSPSTQTGATIGSGWHMFTGTYDGLNVKLYIDGQLSTNTVAYTTKTPIRYATSSNVGLFIGAECGSSLIDPITSGQFFNGKLSDCRIYATCLSADDVLELYNTSASLTNTGILMTNEIVGV